MMGTRTTVQDDWRRYQGFRRLAALLSCALVVAVLVIVPAPRASGVTYTFLVNSLSHQGDDVAPGNGVCLTATGVCTLRAALQESNALVFPDVAVIAPAQDVDAATPGVQSSGTIVGSGTGAANFMFVGTLTPSGDTGAYFMATRSVVLDFQNRLGIASLDDLDEATAVFVNGPDVSIRNFPSITSNATAFVLGSSADRATIENGSCTDPGSTDLDRCVWLATGSDEATVRNVQMGSTSSGGGSAIRIADGAAITGLTLDDVRMYDPDTEAYSGLQLQGTATLTRLTITGSTFEGFQAGTYPVDLRGAALSNATISGNRFTRIDNGADFTTIWVNRPGTNNVIADNTFDNSASDVAGHGVYFSDLGLAATVNSGWVVRDNFFDGRRLNSVWVGAGSGILPVERNTFGPDSFGGGTAENEIDATSLVYNETETANQKINTWYPAALAYDGTECTLDVTVTPPVTPPIPTVAVTIDVYYTATDAAEVFLGSRTGLIDAGTVTVPYTLGPGNIRVQTTAATGATSQYSRTIAQTQADVCGPQATIDQAASQPDPTSIRDVHFTAEFSEAVPTDLAPSAISTTGSTAPGVIVTDVTRISESRFDITARADDTGTIVLSLPAGAVVDAAGNESLASTSTDNSVFYVSPLSVEPEAVTVTEGGPPQAYTVTTTLPATAAITVATTVADLSWATATPSPLVIPSTTPTGTVSVAAVDDTLDNGTRNTSVIHTVSSPDPNFDGLLLPPVAVQVLDDDQPDPATSFFGTTAGTRVADGTDAHTATVVVRNAANAPVSGVLVTFEVSEGATLGETSCITDETGACSVPVTSTTPGVFTVRAFIGGTEEIVGASNTVEFVAGPPSTTTSTIEADPTTAVADGITASTVTVTLLDALGNPVGNTDDVVTIASDLGTLTGAVDNGDGTWTATLTSTGAGTATISFAVNGVTGAATATVDFVAGPVSATASTIAATPDFLPADGASTSTVTVTLRDQFGNPVGQGSSLVTMSASAGTLGAVANNGDGTYTAVLTAPTSTTPPSATISFAVDGTPGSAVAIVAFAPGVPSAAASEIVAAPETVTANGLDASTVTVTLRDANGNLVTDAGPVVTVTTTRGTLTPVVDNGDGTYTATLTSTEAGSATVGFTVSGAAGRTTTVTFVPGPADAATSGIVAVPTELPADGVSTSTVTVTLRDANGNPLTTGGAVVELATTAGTLSAVTDNGDGTYTAFLTAPTAPDSATVSFVVNGAPGVQTAVVTFVETVPSPTTSTIDASPTTIGSDGVDVSTVTVTLRDADGNPLTHGGNAVAMTTTVGTLSAVTDHGDGTYTATLTATVAGVATLGFTVDGATAPDTATVTILDTTPPDVPVITAPADGATVPADVAISGTGEPGATVTVTANATTTCTATVTGAGTWACTPTDPLAEGTTALVAIQTDPAGNESGASPTVTVTVDTTIPPPPVPDATNGARVTGSSEPGTTVTIRGEDGTVLCVTTATDEGLFECLPDQPIPTGTLLLLTATDAAGNESPASAVRVGGASVRLTVATALPGEVQTAIGVGFLPGESVSGLLESTPVDLGTQVADAAGTVTFTVTLPVDIEPGTHRVTLTGPESGAVFAEFEVEAPVVPGQPEPPGTGGPGDRGTGGLGDRGTGGVLPWTGVVGLPALAGVTLLLLAVGALLRRPGRRTA